MHILTVILYALFIFAFQTILYRTTSNKYLQRIPIIIIGLVYITALCLPIADHIMVQQGSNDGYMFYTFIAWLIAGGNTIGLLADGAAWLYENI